MRETPCYKLMVFLTCLMKVTEIQAQCVRPDVGGNRVPVGVLELSFAVNSTVTFKCASGFQPVNLAASRTITCVGTEWTNLDLNCTEKSCGSLSDLPNGKYNYPSGVLFGATAVAECDEGYFLVGKETRNCRDDGWDGRDPACDVVTCAPPPGVKNGSFAPMSEVYDYSNAVVYTCERDYTLIGESTIFCSKNRTFHPPPPQCLLVKCDSPNIENANLVEGKRPPYGYKNAVRYQCIVGYVMNGSGSLVCEENGWNPPPPTCNKKICGQLPDFPNGKYNYTDGVSFGATAIAECNEGYSLVGEKTRTCQDAGWDGNDPKCEAVQKPNPLTTASPSGTNQKPGPQTTAPPSGSTCVKPSVIIMAVVCVLLSF